jgi:hypothetical protein
MADDEPQTFVQQLIASHIAKHGPLPESFSFGDGIDWASEIRETMLYVESPFWLMVPHGDVTIRYADVDFAVSILPPWQEVFAGKVSDAKHTVVRHGPWSKEPWQPPEQFAADLAQQQAPLLVRNCKTMIRITALGHADAFSNLPDDAPPRAYREREAYWASLCEAHIPVLNQLIQQYRLATYDYFAYEVSAWDVPIWYLKQDQVWTRAALLLYKDHDVKPVQTTQPVRPDGTPVWEPVHWTDLTVVATTDTVAASPGEYDLLDARSLMERGDYSGAVRRTTTAVETLIDAVYEAELRKHFDESGVQQRLKKSFNNIPARIKEWRQLSASPISQRLFDDFVETRSLRQEIVHRARRLSLAERGLAQRCIDTSRWLYNQIEGKPERARLRDHDVRKSIGRASMSPRFSARFEDGRLLLYQH